MLSIVQLMEDNLPENSSVQLINSLMSLRFHCHFRHLCYLFHSQLSYLLSLVHVSISQVECAQKSTQKYTDFGPVLK